MSNEAGMLKPNPRQTTKYTDEIHVGTVLFVNRFIFLLIKSAAMQSPTRLQCQVADLIFVYCKTARSPPCHWSVVGQ